MKISILTALLCLSTLVSFGATPPLEELKSEARSLVDGKRTFTQQMVDEIFSFFRARLPGG